MNSNVIDLWTRRPIDPAVFLRLNPALDRLGHLPERAHDTASEGAGATEAASTTGDAG